MLQARLHGLLLVVLLTAIAVPTVGAGDPGHTCAAVDNPAERLACYDRAFPRPAEAGAAAAHVPQQAPGRGGVRAAEPKAPEPTETVEEFGLSGTQLQARDPAPASTRIERIEATVTEVRYRSSGERIITLDNGQVWLQTEVTVRGPLTAGDTVVVRKAALGSFQLVTPGRVALRVRRIE